MELDQFNVQLSWKKSKTDSKQKLWHRLESLVKTLHLLLIDTDEDRVRLASVRTMSFVTASIARHKKLLCVFRVFQRPSPAYYKQSITSSCKKIEANASYQLCKNFYKVFAGAGLASLQVRIRVESEVV